MTKIDHGAEEAARHNIERSPEWPAVAREHLSKEPHCAACKPGASGNASVQVHHIFPFHYCIALGRPDLELDQRNLITLCENEEGHASDNHHLLIGHLNDFKSSNLDVSHDAETTFYGMTANEIKADPRWKNKEAARLKPLDQMSEKEKADFKAAMKARFP